MPSTNSGSSTKQSGRGKRRGLILAALLLVPSLFFLFLLVFGENTYTLATLGPKSLDAKGDTLYHAVDLPGDSQMGARLYTLWQPELSYDEQREVMQACSRLQAGFKEESDFRILTLVSAERNDTLVAALTERFEPTERWVFLSSDQSPTQLWNAALSLADPDLIGNPNAALLVDRDNYVRGAYDLLKGKENDRLQTEIRVLLAIDGSRN